MGRTRNPRITKRERGLLKGGINRVFSRSELRQRALDAATLKDYHDPSRNRVTRWGYCAECGELVPCYLLEIDHIEPRVPIESSFDEMTIDEYIDRSWCSEDLLQALCSACHDLKSADETKERNRLKKGKNK